MDVRGPGNRDIGSKPRIEDRRISDGDMKKLRGQSVEQAYPWDAENNDISGGRRL